MWCIQAITPEYRERMYDVLDLYALPYNPQEPVLCIDEKPKQLLENKRAPIKMQPGKPEKYDYEYRRCGTANVFVAVEPLAGKRITQVTRQRTKKHFALFMQEALAHYPCARKLHVVADNLNTHNNTSFDDNLAKEQAHKLKMQIVWHYTPKHASWLNMAETEIAVMDAQCTGRRINSQEQLTKEVTTWTTQRNQQKKTITWKFTREKADQKLGKYYTE
jgi:hypothetical protein